MDHILIVDDEAEHLRSLRVGLTAKGYEVHAALDAQTALDALKHGTEKATLIITDYAMPDMDGLTLLEKIRENGNSLPSIVMTAYAEKDIVLRALRSGCNGFIEKPFALDELIEEIHRVEQVERRSKEAHAALAYFAQFVHQINNLLFVIQANAEMKLSITEDQDVESLRAGFISISDAVNKIMELNDKIVQFVRRSQLETNQS